MTRVKRSKRNSPDVHLIKNKENVGFARGNNIAAEEAHGRRILLLNPDTLLIDNAIDRLVIFADGHPGNRIWGGKHLFGDRTLNSFNCWGDYSVWTVFCASFALSTIFPRSALFNQRGYPRYDRERESVVDSITGCYLLIDKDLWSELGGFAEEFFLFAEEIDLCRRARDKGAQPLITPDSVIVHFGGGSALFMSEDRKVQLLRAERQYYRKHFGAVSSHVACILSDLGIMMRSMAVGILLLLGQRKGSNRYVGLRRRRAEWA